MTLHESLQKGNENWHIKATRMGTWNPGKTVFYVSPHLDVIGALYSVIDIARLLNPTTGGESRQLMTMATEGGINEIARGGAGRSARAWDGEAQRQDAATHDELHADRIANTLFNRVIGVGDDR